MPGEIRATDRKWKRLFGALWSRIVSDERLQRLPREPRVIFSDTLDAAVCAEIRWDGPGVVITVSTRFVAEVRTELENHQETLVELASEGGRRTPSSARVVGAVEELLVSFILLHEVTHLVNGHVDWMEARKKARSFDERRLGLFSAASHGPGVTKRPSYKTIVKAYLLESEADCTALQWIVQSTYPAGLKQLLGRKAEVITALPDVERLVGFRLVFTAAWLAVRRMEDSRTAWIDDDSQTHPLPGTRLFSAMSTLIQEYASISSLRFDAKGGAHHTLSAPDVEEIKTCLTRILLPVLVANWNPGDDIVEQEKLEALIRATIPDLPNYMLNRKLTTEVGREVVRMERVRLGMYEELAPFRHFPTMRIRPLTK
jgi:hypothetical protein